MIINRQFCSFLHKNLCCGYSLELPHRGDFNEYPQHRFYGEMSGYREADLRLCFRICKKPVFSQRGSTVKWGWKNLSLVSLFGITRLDPMDGFVYPYLTLIIEPRCEKTGLQGF